MVSTCSFPRLVLCRAGLAHAGMSHAASWHACTWRAFSCSAVHVHVMRQPTNYQLASCTRLRPYMGNAVGSHSQHAAWDVLLRCMPRSD